MELDQFDRRLLDALQRDNQQTGERLAETVGLSAAACLRRAQRLREAGIIERDVSILSPEGVGRRLTMIVMITAERHQPHEDDAFARLMRDAAEVMECYHVTGSADYVLILSVTDLEAYKDFMHRHFYSGHVKRFESITVLKRVKFSTAVSMSE